MAFYLMLNLPPDGKENHRPATSNYFCLLKFAYFLQINLSHFEKYGGGYKINVHLCTSNDQSDLLYWFDSLRNATTLFEIEITSI